MTALVTHWYKRQLNIPALKSAWGLSLLIVILIAVFDVGRLLEHLSFTVKTLAQTLPYIAFAIIAIGWLKASNAEGIVASAFQGQEVRMIIVAALVGGLAPFCSCEVIPFVAALLAAGTPVSAVMAFWLSSPLMDPPTFAITAGALGWQFAVGKTVTAVAAGLLGGFVMMWLTALGVFSDPLRPRSSAVSCCSASNADATVMGWFWPSTERRQIFYKASGENALFLLKWLLLAYLLESIMITYVPAEAIASVVGGSGLGSVVVGALAGIPAYLNGYAAPPLVSGLMEQGMNAGAAMSFMVAGAMTCIPAMAAVFALVKREVFAMYVLLALVSAVLSGLIFGAYIV
ncbi:MAG: permease [Granulosicoccus sp.]|nr:permease [Granulosicoccus sp.]